MSHESQMVGCPGMKTTLAGCENLLPSSSCQRETKAFIDSKTNMFHGNMSKFGQECFRASYRLLEEHLRQPCKDAAAARHMKMISRPLHISWGSLPNAGECW